MEQTQLQQDFTTFEIAWSQAVPFPMPHKKYVVQWIRKVPIDQILTLLENLQRYHAAGKLDRSNPEEHASRFIGASVRRMTEQQAAPQY